MINTDINKLNQSDIYSIVCELLYTVHENPEYSVMSELAYILDKDSFIKFIQYFGGTTLTVPTLEEFKQTLKIIQLYHYFNVENIPWKEALEKAGFSRNENRSAQSRLLAFTKVLNSVKIGRSYKSND